MGWSSNYPREEMSKGLDLPHQRGFGNEPPTSTHTFPCSPGAWQPQGWGRRAMQGDGRGAGQHGAICGSWPLARKRWLLTSAAGAEQRESDLIAADHVSAGSETPPLPYLLLQGAARGWGWGPRPWSCAVDHAEVAPA